MKKDKLIIALEEFMAQVEEPGERNCSCHISPPCNDCVDNSGLREAFELARNAIKEIEKTAPDYENMLYQRCSSDSTLGRLYEMWNRLPACEMLAVIGGAIQDLQYYDHALQDEKEKSEEYLKKWDYHFHRIEKFEAMPMWKRVWYAILGGVGE